MSVVCGADFSEGASQAATAAAHLAARLDARLHLVHSIDLVSDDDSNEALRVYRRWAEERLRREVERLSSITRDLEIHVESTPPDDAVLTVAARVSASLVVVGHAGRRGDAAHLGTQADRIAHRSHVPVLVVREAAPFVSWARGERPLRVLAGADATLSTEHALRWVARLQAIAPCDVTAIHVYWPPEEFHRLGFGGLRNYVDPDPEVTAALEREFAERALRIPELAVKHFRAEPHLGRVSDHLAMLAREDEADLIVVGSHERSALRRAWEGSVSRSLLHLARGSVALVPTPVVAHAAPPPTGHHVVVATDFTSAGDSAIATAYGLAPTGTTVHVVHVVAPSYGPREPHDIFVSETEVSASAQLAKIRQNLADRIPRLPEHTQTRTELHLLAAHDAARAICQAAERLGARFICVGTRGRTGVAKAVLGSVASEVVARSTRPVLLTHAPAP